MARSRNFEPKLPFHLPKPKTENQQWLWDALRDNRINYVFVSGPAGVGKTFLSCAHAAEGYMAGKYSKIVIARSVLPIKNEAIGFKKGTKDEKLAGWVSPMRKNLEKFIPDSFILNKAVELQPIGEIRGQSIEQSVLLIDEAQNLDMEALFAIITRTDERTKLIFMGDLVQNDTKRLITHAEVFCRALSPVVDAFEWVQLTDADQQRNPNITLITKTIQPYLSDRACYLKSDK